MALEGWGEPIKVTIDHNRIDADLYDFPLLIHLSEHSGRDKQNLSAIFDELNYNDRKKIAVTTAGGEVQCYVELGYWSDVDRQIALWVKAPHVLSLFKTVLYFYYDPTQTDNDLYVGDVNSPPAEMVWDDYFTHVFHFMETSGGIPGEFKDSTRNRNHAHGNTVHPPVTIINELGLPCQWTNGEDQTIIIPDSDGLSIPVPGKLSIEYMRAARVLKKGWPTKYVCPMCKWGWGPNGEQWRDWTFQFYDYDAVTSGPDADRPHRCSYYVYNTLPATTSPGGNYQPAEIMPIDSWWHFCAVAHANSPTSGIQYIYRDGEHRGAESTWEAYGITYVPSPAPVIIGHNPMSPASLWDDSRFYEVRYSHIDRSQEWMKATSYSNQDKLLSFESSVIPPVVKAGVPMFIAGLIIVALWAGRKKNG